VIAVFSIKTYGDKPWMGLIMDFLFEQMLLINLQDKITILKIKICARLPDIENGVQKNILKGWILI
jgi:hypothetical protein